MTLPQAIADPRASQRNAVNTGVEPAFLATPERMALESRGHHFVNAGEIGAGTAAVFIAFALVTALLIPRYRPDFPGRKGVGLFVVATLLLTVAMIGAVVVFASEDEGAEAAGHSETELTETGPAETETGPAETETGPAETETETGETETTPSATTAPEEEAPAGDPAAGKTLFASNGCDGCHTIEAAGSTGAVGPN